MAYSRPQPKGITHILKQKNTEKSDNTFYKYQNMFKNSNKSQLRGENVNILLR